MELHEIQRHIGKFLSVSDLKACSLVSRAWAESMVPWIWWSITLGPSTPLPPPEAMDRHFHQTRSLSFIRENGMNSNLYPLFNQLQSLHIVDPPLGSLEQLQPFTDLICRNGSTIHTIVQEGNPSLPAGVLRAILECPSLKQLTITKATFLERDLEEQMLQTCTRLTHLTLHTAHFSDMNLWQSNGLVFRHLESLRLSNVHSQVQLEILRQSPNLQRLVLTEKETISKADFVQVVIPSCPKLCALVYHRLCLPLDEQDSFVNALPPMKCLLIGHPHARRTCLPSPLSLAPHFESLQVVDLLFFKEHESPSVQAILSSCPNLRFISGGRIEAKDVQDGSPWVCLGLCYFGIRILDFEEDKELQAIVFWQISRLTRLRVLDIGRMGLARDKRRLRVNEGLGLLSSLKELDHIDFMGLLLNWKLEEIEWMLRTWPQLRSAYIRFHEDIIINQKLWSRCKAAGIRNTNPPIDIMEFVKVDRK